MILHGVLAPLVTTAVTACGSNKAVEKEPAPVAR